MLANIKLSYPLLQAESTSHCALYWTARLGARFVSTDVDQKLSAHKLKPKTLTEADPYKGKLLSKETNELYQQPKDTRGLLKKVLKFPIKTAALEDKLPAILYSREQRSRIISLASFYNNLVIYDFPKLPPVKHLELEKVQQEYHGMLSSDLDAQTLWFPLFRMPGIVRLRAIIRSKVYMTAISSCFLAKELYHLVDAGFSFDLAPALALAISTFGGLIYVGTFVKQLVIQIYTTEDCEHLRFSRFTFYGNRRDIIVPIDCVMPLTETNVTMRAPFYTLKFVKPKDIDLEHDFHEFYNEKLRICVLFGGIRERELFEAVLGKLLRNKVGA